MQPVHYRIDTNQLVNSELICILVAVCYSTDYSSSLKLSFTDFQQHDWKKYECVVENKQNQSVVVSQLNIVVIRKLASS